MATRRYSDHTVVRMGDMDIAQPQDKQELDLGAATSLYELTKEYRFFTPALLYIHQIVNDAPLTDFLVSYRQPVTFYWKIFERDLFAGLEVDGDATWNRALWAIRLEHWAAFRAFYGMVQVANRVTGRRYAVVAQDDVPVVDPLAVSRRVSGGPLPTLSITAFGFDCNDGVSWAFAGERENPAVLPRAQRVSAFRGHTGAR